MNMIEILGKSCYVRTQPMSARGKVRTQPLKCQYTASNKLRNLTVPITFWYTNECNGIPVAFIP